MEVRAGRVNTGISPSAAANEAVAQGRHGARPTQRGRQEGRQGKHTGEISEVRGDEGGRKASGVDHDNPKVGDKEGGHEASGVAENPQGSCQGVGGGVESPRVNSTPIVT